MAIDFLNNIVIFKRPSRFNRIIRNIQTSYPTDYDYVIENSMSEGLITTYPFNFTGRRAAKLFGKYVSGITYDDGQFVVRFPACDELSDEIKKMFDACGWFCSVETFNDIAGETELIFEAKFTKKTNAADLPKEYSTLVHATPSYNKEKILRNGFVPACKNDMFEYPGRIYFTPTCADIESFYRFICVLWAKRKNKNTSKDYTLFIVDSSKMKNVSFEMDQNYKIRTTNGNEICGLYTTDNIAPNSIVRHFDINIDSIMKILGIRTSDMDKLMPFENLLKEKQ